MSDLRFAARMLVRSPGFAIAATLTLAFGIGATTTVFSVVESVLLRPLPYQDPDRLTAIWLTSTREQALAKIFATHADFVAFRRRSQSFADLAAATWATPRTGRILTGFGDARQLLTIPATVSFFRTLGVEAALGRFRAAITSLFAAAALLLSLLGLHGVLSQFVTERLPELGVRRAVGAGAGHLVWLVLRQGSLPVIAGLLAGVALATGLGRALSSVLYGAAPAGAADPRTLAVVSALFLATASLAMLLPAGRAVRVDPVTVLRQE